MKLFTDLIDLAGWYTCPFLERCLAIMLSDCVLVVDTIVPYTNAFQFPCLEDPVLPSSITIHPANAFQVVFNMLTHTEEFVLSQHKPIFPACAITLSIPVKLLSFVVCHHRFIAWHLLLLRDLLRTFLYNCQRTFIKASKHSSNV